MPEKRIELLDAKVINKIAAGEVIENAASIIKELVDNALDAGAQAIRITTQKGGRSLIEVSDDGHGIAKEELPLAIVRHATSKIASVEDLLTLSTMGFRGEALAAIGAVARLTIHSATLDAKVGSKMVVEEGEVVTLDLAARKRGTTIRVEDLFYNLPVRKKFQKSLAFETQEIHKQLIALLLPYSSLHFRWIHDDKELIALDTPRDLLSSIEGLLGREFASELFFMEASCGKMGLKGYLAPPMLAKSHRLGQYLYVNNRSVQAPLVANAVKAAFGTRIGASEFPAFVLFLHLPPHLIDVNVHPQKKTVHFQEEKEIETFVEEEVKKALEKRFQPVFSISAPPKPLTQPLYTVVPAFLEEKAPIAAPLPPFFHLVAIVEGYFIIEKEHEGLFLIEAQRALARIFFESLKVTRQVAVQPLLFPWVFEATPAERHAIETNEPLFQELKISCRSLGENSFVIEALPQGMSTGDIPKLLEQLVENKGKKAANIATLIPHFVRKRTFTFAEAHATIDALFKCQTPHLCPEGKPTLIPWPKNEIRRLFLG